MDHTHKACDDKKNKIAILSLGGRLQECLKAAEELEKQGYAVTVADARFAKPLDTDLIRHLATYNLQLVTVEEGSRGGFGAAVLEYLANNDLLRDDLKIRTLTLPDIFQDQDAPDKQYAQAGLDAAAIIMAFKK